MTDEKKKETKAFILRSTRHYVRVVGETLGLNPEVVNGDLQLKFSSEVLLDTLHIEIYLAPKRKLKLKVIEGGKP